MHVLIAGGIQNRPDIAGQVIGFPHCGKQFQLPALAVAKAIPVAMPARAPATPPIPSPLVAASPPLPPPPTFPFAVARPPSPGSGAAPRESQRKARRSSGNTAMVLIVAGVIAVPLLGVGGFFAWQQSQPPPVKKAAKRSAEKSANPKTEAIADASKERISDTRLADQSKPAKPRFVPTYQAPEKLPNGEVNFIASATQEKYDRIREGMTKKELFSFMGEPPALKTEHEPDGVVEYYMWGSRGRYGVVHVTTKNGKVLSKSLSGRL